jgi:hypothetical protein
MYARIWITTLLCAALVSSSGCGSCRWGRRHGVTPWACVEPRCGDPACMVCSPVPPLYDGWSNQQAMFGSHGHGSCCGGMSCGDCQSCEGTVIDGATYSSDDGSSGMPQMMGNCPHCGHDMGGSVITDDQSAREHNAMIFSSPPVEFSTPPSEPTPADAAKSSPASSTTPPGTIVPPPSSLPMDSLSAPMKDAAAPAPPIASPASATSPSDFYAPNKPSIGGPAPVPLSGPIRLQSPPVWETSLEITPVEQASLKAPTIP